MPARSTWAPRTSAPAGEFGARDVGADAGARRRGAARPALHPRGHVAGRRRRRHPVRRDWRYGVRPRRGRGRAGHPHRWRRRRASSASCRPATTCTTRRCRSGVPLTLDPANPGGRGGHFLYLVGRLKDGVTMRAGRGRRRDHAGAVADAESEDAHAQPETASPPARRPADRSRRRHAACAVGASGGGRIRPADRLRQPREPAAGARRVTAEGVRGAVGARGEPLAPGAAVPDRGRAAGARRRHARRRRRLRRPARADRRQPAEPATSRRDHAGSVRCWCSRCWCRS